MIHLIIVITVLALSHLFCFAIISELKYSVKKTAAIYGMTAIIFVSIVAATYSIMSNDIKTVFSISYMITIAICFVVFFFTSRDPVLKKIFLYISYSNIFCILWGLSDIISQTVDNGFSLFETMYIKNMIRTLVTIPLMVLYIEHIRPIIRGISSPNRKTWAALSLASGLFLIVFSLLVSKLYRYIFKDSSYVLTFMMFSFIYISVLWVIFCNIVQMSKEAKTALIYQKDKYLQSELEIARQNEMVSKRMRHDYRHHIQNIASMLRNGDTQHCLDYIKRYDDSLSSLNRTEICPNVIVNAILTSFHTMAQNSGISFYISADIPEHSAIADTDYVAILSNILENALNACKECDSTGEIRVNIRMIENKIVIVCSNPCKNDIEIVDNMIKNKGIGIDSIIASSRKYNGDINYTLENSILTVCVILKT